MTTEAQQTANRENAKRSTGPKTATGKARSSRNAVRHGILASVIPADTPGFQETLEGLYRSLRPMDEAQRLLVDQIAVATVRLQRVIDAEQLFLEIAAAKAGCDLPDGVAVADYLASDSATLSLRYEAALNRIIHKNLRLLREMKGDWHWNGVRSGDSPYIPPDRTEEPTTIVEDPAETRPTNRPDPNQPELAKARQQWTELPDEALLTQIVQSQLTSSAQTSAIAPFPLRGTSENGGRAGVEGALTSYKETAGVENEVTSAIAPFPLRGTSESRGRAGVEGELGSFRNNDESDALVSRSP